MEKLTMMNESMKTPNANFDYMGVEKPNADQTNNRIVAAVIVLGMAGAGYWVGRNVVEPLIVKAKNVIVGKFKNSKVKKVENPDEE